MPLIDDVTYDRAIANIAEWGDTDVFPFPVDNHVLHDRSDEVRDVLKEIERDFDAAVNRDIIASYSSLAPVGYHGFRWATQIDPVWNAYLLSAVLQLAPGIEETRIAESQEMIFSYRYRASSKNGLFASEGWKNFQHRTRELAESHQFVVSVDIADFYARVYHHPIENALRNVEPGGNLTKQIKTLLSKLSNNTSYGLPVGGPAARLISELLLNQVDRLLLYEPSTNTFVRYADDYRFFVNDLPTAYRAIGHLSEKLFRLEGLSLQKAKTRILTSAEYLSLLDPVELPAGSAAKFLSLHIHFDPYSATAEEDYDRLSQKIQEFDILGMLRSELTKGRVHAALTRRLVSALKYMDAETRWQALLSLMENVETLAPVLPQVMLAIRDCLRDLEPEQVETIHGAVRGLINANHYTTQVDLNLAYMVRTLAHRHSAENEKLLARLYKGPHGFGDGHAPNLQRDIMLILARWNARAWLRDQKNNLGTMHPWVKRSFIIASYSMGDEGRHWRDANKAGFSPFDLVVRNWVAEKSASPSWSIPV